MSKVKNVVVEVVRDEDGCVSVRKCGVSEYEWLGYVMGEGGFEGCDIEEVEGKFDEYMKVEVEDGWVGEGVDWNEMKREFVEEVKNSYGDDVMYVGYSLFGVECDSSLVVMICKG